MPVCNPPIVDRDDDDVFATQIAANVLVADQIGRVDQEAAYKRLDALRRSYTREKLPLTAVNIEEDRKLGFRLETLRSYARAHLTHILHTWLVRSGAKTLRKRQSSLVFKFGFCTIGKCGHEAPNCEHSRISVQDLASSGF